MKRTLWAGMALWASCCLFQAKAWDIPFAGDCAFYVSFDSGDLMADISVGKPDATVTPPGTAPVFSENGVRGKALLASWEDNIRFLNYQTEGNFSCARPGTLSMWIQPVKWRRGDELPEDPRKEPGWRQPTYTVFFRAGRADGIMGVQRMTSAYLTKPNSLDFTQVYYRSFPKLKDITAYGRTEWADGEWHHVALSWNREEIRLYVDGKQEGPAVSLIGAIDTESDPKMFSFGSQGDPSLIDELALYNRTLSPEEIKTLFDAYQPVEKGRIGAANKKARERQG